MTMNLYRKHIGYGLLCFVAMSVSACKQSTTAAQKKTTTQVAADTNNAFATTETTTTDTADTTNTTGTTATTIATSVATTTTAITTTDTNTSTVNGLGTACPNGTYIEAEDMCTKTNNIKVKLESDWLENSSCTDHFGMMNFTLIPIQAGKVEVKAVMTNYSPSMVAGANCTYTTKEWGTLTLKSPDGVDISTVASLASLSFEYNSYGNGCGTMTGTTADTNVILGKCPGTDDQTLTIKIKAHAEAIIPMWTKTIATCPTGQTRVKGACLAPN